MRCCRRQQKPCFREDLLISRCKAGYTINSQGSILESLSSYQPWIGRYASLTASSRLRLGGATCKASSNMQVLGNSQASKSRQSKQVGQAPSYICLSAQVCTGISAVSAAKACNRAPAERLLLVRARHDGPARRCFRLCCLGQATGCLNEQRRASRASTRLQLKSRTWHKHNLRLQGATHGSKLKAQSKETQMSKQRLRCLWMRWVCSCRSSVCEGWTRWAKLRLDG